MRITVKDATFLKECIDAIANIVSEGSFFFGKEGIRLKAMDPSQISMIDFFAPSSAFDEYEVEEEKQIGINIAQLSTFLGRCKKGDKATLEIDNNTLSLILHGKDRKKTFKLNLLDLGEALQKDIVVPHNAHIKMSSDGFKEILKDAKLISPYIAFIVRSNMFIYEVRGESGEEAKGELTPDCDDIVEIKLDDVDEVKEAFNLQYLDDVMKGCPSGAIIELHLGVDPSTKRMLPLKLQYDIRNAKINYFLAPRNIDDEF